MIMDWRRITWAFMAIVVVGCSTPKPAPVEEKRDIPQIHLVARGETLSEIAIRYQLDYLDLAEWNELASPDKIYAGQRLRLNAPRGYSFTSAAEETRVTASPVPTPQERVVDSGTVSDAHRRDARLHGNRPAWRWPIEGRVEREYQPDVPGRKGIQIRGSLGQSVRAASEGEVVYSGSGLPGYGRLIIVKHTNAFLSAYGYLGKILVAEGDRVRTGQTIAELGSSNENRPVLHFEIRRDGKPVNPRYFLPS